MKRRNFAKLMGASFATLITGMPPVSEHKFHSLGPEKEKYNIWCNAVLLNKPLKEWESDDMNNCRDILLKSWEQTRKQHGLRAKRIDYKKRDFDWDSKSAVMISVTFIRET